MITEFYVSQNSLILEAVATPPAVNYEFGLLWYYDTYKDLTKSFDITPLVSGGAIEKIDMTTAFLGLDSLDGIFYVQLFDNQVANFKPLVTPLNNDYELAVCTNLSKSYNYFLSTLLLEIDNINCDCSNCLESTRILTLIEGIKSSLVLGEFTIANTLYEELSNIITNCTDCNYPTVEGYNIQTLNGVITLI